MNMINNEKVVKIELTREQIETIIEVLSLAPYYRVADIISRLIYFLNESNEKGLSSQIFQHN